MNNKERCIKILNDFDENQLASVAEILQNIKNFAAVWIHRIKIFQLLSLIFPIKLRDKN